VQQCEVVGASLLESRCDRAKALQVVEEDLDEVPTAIQLSVERQRSFTFWLGVNYRLHAACADLGAVLVGVVARVADESRPSRVVEQLEGRDQLVTLTWRQRDVERPPLRVDDRVDFS